MGHVRFPLSLQTLSFVVFLFLLFSAEARSHTLVICVDFVSVCLCVGSCASRLPGGQQARHGQQRQVRNFCPSISLSFVLFSQLHRCTSVCLIESIVCVCLCGRSCRIWDYRTLGAAASSHRAQVSFDGHTDSCTSVCMDGYTVLSGSNDNTARVWYVSLLRCLLRSCLFNCVCCCLPYLLTYHVVVVKGICVDRLHRHTYLQTRRITSFGCP